MTSTTYELHNNLKYVAKAIVTKGEGIKMMDRELLLKDVDEALAISYVGKRYYSLSNEIFEANQKAKAAQTLDMDDSPYRNQVVGLSIEMAYIEDYIREYLKGWTYGSYTGWTRVDKP